MNKPATKFRFNMPRDLVVVAIAMFIWGLGEGLFIYFLPLALQQWQANAVQIGGVLSLIGVMMALVQVPAGYLSDRFGTRPLIFTALILGVVSALWMALAQSLALFSLGLLAYGLTSLISAPLNSYLTSVRGSWSVQRTVTFVFAALQVGTIFGPVLGGWIADTAGMSVVFRYSFALFLAATLVVVFTRPATATQVQETSAQHTSPLTNPRFLALLAAVFITVIALSVPQQLTSLYLQEVHQLSIQQIGTLGTLASSGTAVLMLLLGSIRPPAGMLVGQLLIAGYALLLWRGQSVLAFSGGYFLVGGYRLYRSMALAFSRSLVKAGDTGLAYGLVETGNALAIIIAPLAAGLLYDQRPENVYIAALAALAVTMPLNGLLLRKFLC